MFERGICINRGKHLISGAVKYNGGNGSVSVAIEFKNNRAVIRVSDTGIGMTPDESSRLFNDFMRIQNEKTENILGSGLGLSIVKKIALLYRGGVSVESRPGEGSVFTVELLKGTGAGG